MQERRRYIRLETVFPVEFQFHSTPLRQGFTRDVSEGGMCLEVNEVENGIVDKLREKGAELILYINIPRRHEPIKARAKVCWAEKIKDSFPKRFLIGLEYLDIKDTMRKAIIGYAKRLRRRPKIVTAVVFLSVLLSGILIYEIHQIGIKKAVIEKRLVKLENTLSRAQRKRVSLTNKISLLNKEQEKMETDIYTGKEKIDSLETRLQKVISIGEEMSEEFVSQRTTLQDELAIWKDKSKQLRQELLLLQNEKERLSGELVELKKMDEMQIVRIRLTNGNWITGELISCDTDRMDVRIGQGSVGIERAMISDIKEVSTLEKIDIQHEWKQEEESARENEKKKDEFIEKQYARGLVYFNGKWLKKENAKAIQEELKRKEEEAFLFVTKQRSVSLSGEGKHGLLSALLKKRLKPVISIMDKRIYVNARLFFIKGVGYGLEYPNTPGSKETYRTVPISVFEKDFRMMKEAGVNTIRTYEPLPEELLDLAERYNIMVIENICYPCENTDFASRVHLDVLKEQIRQYVLRDKDRPCILAWSIWNDAPWIFGKEDVVQRYGFNNVNRFLKELYDTVREFDITHPVTGANALGVMGESLGWDFIDIIGLNAYIGGHDWFLEEDAKKQVAVIKGIEEKYNKPVVVLETGFSTFIKSKNQAEVLEKQIEIAGTNFAGLVIFQWADGWQKAGNPSVHDMHIEEHWGILDGYRIPKPGYRTICRLFNIIPTESYGYEKHRLTQMRNAD